MLNKTVINIGCIKENCINKLSIKSILDSCEGNLFIQNDTIAKLQGFNEENEIQELCQKCNDKLYGGCECYIHVFVLFYFFFKCALKSITDL